jgi:starch-binding outer membrane protein SusE/F
MKNTIKVVIAISLLSLTFFACKKNIEQTVMTNGLAPVITLSPSNLTLLLTTAADTVETISWSPSDYGYSAAVNYSVQLAKSGTGFASPQTVNVGNAKRLKYLGAVLNDLAIGLGIVPGTTGSIDIRIKSSLSDSLSIYSSITSLTIKTYVVQFPALLVRGGNSWVTPTIRTNGFLLASPNFDTKYEGYINLPNADGWGGDAFKLLSTSSGSEYGWGTSSTTMSIGGGNLWLTPSPNYMKVNADVNALTINYTLARFYISGDHNGWSTSATPMNYDAATKTLKATNVSFTAGNKFVFTCNGGYDISYKVDGAGKLIFAGPPGWSGTNISAPGTGVYTVILDLSGGNGSYTYSIQ